MQLIASHCVVIGTDCNSRVAWYRGSSSVASGSKVDSDLVFIDQADVGPSRAAEGKLQFKLQVRGTGVTRQRLRAIFCSIIQAPAQPGPLLNGPGTRRVTMPRVVTRRDRNYHPSALCWQVGVFTAKAKFAPVEWEHH